MPEVLSGSRGSRIRKQTPCPRFSTEQEPPWAVTAACTMASPSPVPPLSRLRERFRGSPDFELRTIRGFGYMGMPREDEHAQN